MNKYKILKTVYRGNSDVFEAMRIDDNSRVAIKCTSKESGELEKKVLLKLHSPKPHPNIIQLLDSFDSEDASNTFLVFPFVEDQNRILSKHTVLIRESIKQLLQTLDYIHSVGFAHLDVKPGNLLFDGTRVVLIDFGHALDLSHVNDAQVGTGAYSPPELHYCKSHLLSEKIDVWSAGVILHEWLTGKRLFPSDRSLDKIDEFTQTIEALDEFTFGDPVHLGDDDKLVVEALLFRMLQNEPKHRASIKECLSCKWIERRSETKEGPSPGPTRTERPSDLSIPKSASSATSASTKPPFESPRSIECAVASVNSMN